MLSKAPSSTSPMSAELILQLHKMPDTGWIHSMLPSHCCDSVCEGVPLTTLGGNTFLSASLIDSWYLSALTFISSYFSQPVFTMFCSSLWLFGAFVRLLTFSESDKRQFEFIMTYNIRPPLPTPELVHCGFESLFQKQWERKTFFSPRNSLRFFFFFLAVPYNMWDAGS